MGWIWNDFGITFVMCLVSFLDHVVFFGLFCDIVGMNLGRFVLNDFGIIWVGCIFGGDFLFTDFYDITIILSSNDIFLIKLAYYHFSIILQKKKRFDFFEILKKYPLFLILKIFKEAPTKNEFTLLSLLSNLNF